MAYDSARRAVVVFGGLLDGAVLGDTWELDGEDWDHVATNGPAPRSGAAMAYDSARGVTILFGGRNGTMLYGDTWEWNGSSWTLKASTGPSARFGHALVEHAADGTLVLFGGSTQAGPSGETWTWDGQSWTMRNVEGPAPRFDHAMSYDSRRGRTVLFGGNTAGSVSAETWEWDGLAWTIRDVDGPPARSGHAMTFHMTDGLPGRGVTLLFGGGAGVSDDMTWSYDGARWTFRTDFGPSPRRGHAMVFHAGSNATILFGGNDGSDQGDTWVWWDDGWDALSAQPSPRRDHGMAYDSKRGVTVLFGGWYGEKLNDTWEWNGLTWKPRFPRHRPPPMVRHTLTYDRNREVTVLFSGYSDEGFQPETWEWDGNDWYRVALYDPSDPDAGPSPREEYLMFYDGHNQVVALVGGWMRPTLPLHADRTWYWNGDWWNVLSYQPIDPSEPYTMYQSAVAYDEVRKTAVFFGGGSFVSPFTGASPGFGRKTREWDSLTLTWAEKANCDSALCPSPRALHAMVYDQTIGRVLLFGGLDTVERNDLWTWDGTVWSPLIAAGPRPVARYDHGMVYDSRRHVSVMYGGMDSNGVVHGDLWELTVGATPADFNCDGYIDIQDTAHWQACANGPAVPLTAPGCDDADLDHDNDVDMDDLGLIQRCYSGPNALAALHCGH